MEDKKKILWIEDEQSRIEYYKNEAFPQTKYDVDLVKEIEIDDIKYHYDLIIIDLLLPRNNRVINRGLELISQIRIKYKKIPILVFSAVQNPIIIDRALSKGADKYIEKYPPVKDFIVEVNLLLMKTYNLF
jgi:CheY-like chemotaxis protein